MAEISEFSYTGLAGEYVEIRLPTGEDPSPYAIEIYTKSGSVAALASTIPISSGTFSTDGTYDFYVIFTNLANGPRDAIALSENGVAIDFVAWGATGSVPISGGSLDGTSLTSIGTPLNSGSTTSLSKDPDGNWVEGTATPGSNVVFCFAGEVMLATPNGARRADGITPGTQLWTMDHGVQAVRWVGSRYVTAAEMRMNPNQRPVLIRTGALGPGVPERDLRVSRQHRMLIRSAIARRMTGDSEVLVPAIRLVGLPGIEIDMTDAPVEYIHLLFDRHELLLAEGALAESLLATAQTLAPVPARFRRDIERQNPEPDFGGPLMKEARPILEGKRVRRMVWRHQKNRIILQDLVSALRGKKLAQQL
ncbi:Hint domain-containing protein [Palleronia caenipelagi]|uniref:Hint domain-containing protein n=1 Tax=Palleronia caenipelagi TaxID=2489174 RepID=A0A547PKF1_9RHOB|nr:Hint domain-containing protein [Palleronia caenipelagi]TRD14606.1 Hint domain-containing protein [Palleronia caenipelagi]